MTRNSTREDYEAFVGNTARILDVMNSTYYTLGDLQETQWLRERARSYRDLILAHSRYAHAVSTGYATELEEYPDALKLPPDMLMEKIAIATLIKDCYERIDLGWTDMLSDDDHDTYGIEAEVTA